MTKHAPCACYPQGDDGDCPAPGCSAPSRSASRYSNTWSGDEFLGEVQRVLIERGLKPEIWPSRTAAERDDAVLSCAGWCEDRMLEIEKLKAELAAVRSEQQRVSEAAGSNYICDHDTFPQRVEFANGRVVKMVGQGHLFIGWKKDGL